MKTQGSSKRNGQKFKDPKNTSRLSSRGFVAMVEYLDFDPKGTPENVCRL